MAWIGFADLAAARGKTGDRLGPIAQAVEARNFSHLFLLSALKEKDGRFYKNWLEKQKFTNATIEIYQKKLSSPTEFGEIYQSTRDAIGKFEKKLRDKGVPGFSLTFHLSPGTPIMAAVWIFHAKTSYPAELIISSLPEQGVQSVSLPFEITVDYSPDLILKQDEGMLPSAPPEFGDIICGCSSMKNLIAQAHKVAFYDDFPVLILGESGTGKELFAQAIRNSSPRKEKPFVSVNCGAIPKELLESELFGHEKGAFSGAHKSNVGRFEEANNGTLFLDEIGEMGKDLQVKILRALQEKEIRRVGGEKPIPVDIRIITATNRNVYQDVSNGNFRKDLFYRIAGEILELPPLNAREGDLDLLIKYFLDRKNEEYKEKPGWEPKTISPSAKNLLHIHDWPGNVRELENTLVRAALSSQRKIINEQDIKKAMLIEIHKENEGEEILSRNLGKGFNLENVFKEVARHYIKHAFIQQKGRGTKKEAARLLGFKSHQRLTYWIKKLELHDEL